MICKRILAIASYRWTILSASIGLLAGPAFSLADQVSGQADLAQANRLSIFHDYAIDITGQTQSVPPGVAGGGVATPLLGGWASTDTDGSGRSYNLHATPVFGYDSLPEARRNANGGSVFGGIDLGADYRIDLGPSDPTVGSPTQFKFAYDAAAVIYDGNVFNANSLQQTASASYRRSLFQDSLYIGFAFNDQFSTEHGDPFLNTVDAIPSLEWFMVPQASVEVVYDYTNLEYYIRASQLTNPDADRNTISAKFHYYPTPHQRGPIPDSEDVLGDILRQSLTRATVGYAAVFNEANRDDYQYESNRMSLGFEGVRYPGLDDVTMDVGYNYEWQRFALPNHDGPLVLAGKQKYVRRNDHLNVITLRTNAHLFDLPRHRGTIDTFLQWDLIYDHSNIAVRDFNEFVISGGISYRF